MKKHVLAGLALFAIGFAVYGNSMTNQFVWDDTRLIVNNPQIKQWSNLPTVFVENIGATSQDRHSTYRPLHMVSNMIDYSLWTLEPWGYHLTNILLHAGASLALYWFILTLSGSITLSFVTSVFFLVHPVYTEAVTYVSGRADPLMAVFMLVAATAYVRSVRGNGRVWLGLMAISFILALFAKEYALILPALLLVYHWTLREGRPGREFLTLAGISFVFVLLRVTETLGMMRMHHSDTTALTQRIPGFFVAFYHYIKLLVFPIPLHMEYGRDLFPWTHPLFMAGLGAFAGLVFWAVRCKNRAPFVSFSIAWFMIALLPVSNLIPVNAYMAEHWLYIPSVGIFFLAALFVRRLYEKKGCRQFTVCASVLLLCVYASLTVRQNAFWRDPVSFYTYSLVHAPDSTRLHSNLASVYLEQGRYDQAMEHLERAIELDPQYANAYNNLGMVYDATGRPGDAVKFYQKAIDIDETHIDAMNNLAVHYATQGRVREAIGLFQDVLKLNPTIVDAHMNLCVIYGRIGEVMKAIDSCRAAIRQDPELALAYNNLGAALSVAGHKEEALEVYRQSLRINPGDFHVYNNIGSIYAQIKDYDNAAKAYRQALALNPQYQMARENLKIVSGQGEAR